MEGLGCWFGIVSEVDVIEATRKLTEQLVLSITSEFAIGLCEFNEADCQRASKPSTVEDSCRRSKGMDVQDALSAT